MKTPSEIVSKSEAYVSSIYNKQECRDFTYHNWEHTKLVRSTAREIGIAENLTKGDLENLELAALFHDVAYFKGADNHEVNSGIMAQEFLGSLNFPKNRITEVVRLILATKMGVTAVDLLEKIIKDSDTAHLGNKEYFETAYQGLLAEFNTVQNLNINKDHWPEMCVEFMNKHEYQTAFAKNNFEEQKRNNVRTLLEKMEKSSGNKKVDKVAVDSQKNENVEKKKSKKNKKDSNAPEKGIETMFRVALKNHVSLSRIADNKANTLISVNAIIISIVLSTMFPKMDNNPYLIYPGLAIIIFSIITIILSILSTIPKTTHGRLSRKEVEQKKGNLIFFGNFHKMSLEDYEWGISELMKDKDYLYKSLTRDLYFLGKVLNGKYTLLRFSYYTFVIGLVVSITLFAFSLKSMGR